MKKTVFKFGSIAGLIITSQMLVTTIMCYRYPDYESNKFIGFSAMIISFAFIFIGIKSFRDKYNGGVIKFGKAFSVGLLIGLVAATIYTITWLVEFYAFIPDFLDKYAPHVIKEAQAHGATKAQQDTMLQEMAKFKDTYKNPLMVTIITYSEVLPMALVVSVISALVLKRKEKKEQ